MRRARKPGRPAQVRRVTARINEQIGGGAVRLVAEDGTQLGVMAADDARAFAYERGLDLVEVAAASEPPVCRVMDYGKWRYEEERKLRQSRRNQVHVSLKEVRLRPKIGIHDYEWKREQALDFLKRGSKVKATVFFRGREREHPEAGRKLLERLAEDVREVGHPQGRESFEGRTMTVILSPNGATA